MALLELQQLTKRFGGLTAVSGLDLKVDKGEIVGLIGPNGAGKTTVFNMISGVYKPTSGKVFFKDHNVTGWSSHRIASIGLTRTFQALTVFSDLTVMENIRLGSHLLQKVGFWPTMVGTPHQREKEQELLEKAHGLADFFGLRGMLNETARNLSHGHQKALEVAIGMAADPELLLLDEPVAGMSAEETQEMMKIIRRTRDTGITILLVEHDMKMVMDICDRLYVLNFGTLLCEGNPEHICTNPEVISAYLGSEYMNRAAN